MAPSRRSAYADLFRLGHPSRMKLHPTARFLITAHLIVFALSLEDEEIVEIMAQAWNLGPRAAGVAEAVLSLGLLALWGLLTLGWVRFARAMNDDH